MKKVFVLVAAAMLVASSSMAAAVSATKHNLSTSGTGTIKSTDSDQICVFCHTPHGATAASGIAPLWNRTSNDPTSAYGDPVGSMDSTADVTNAVSSDAPLCLSCHDGATVAGALNNPPNALGGSDPAFAAPNDTLTGLDTDINQALNNDHPIGMQYDNAVATDAELKALPAGLPFFQTGNEVWCSTCHDVHGTAVPAAADALLRVDNAASALCLTCHTK